MNRANNGNEIFMGAATQSKVDSHRVLPGVAVVAAYQKEERNLELRVTNGQSDSVKAKWLNG